MYAVIFRAETAQLDATYGDTVAQLRTLAFNTYGCVDFVAVTEGNTEIAISYWHDEQAIRRWKQDTQHLFAQQTGRDKWYSSYTVQVVKIEREYSFSHSNADH